MDPDTEHSLEGVHLRIVTVEDWPFTNVRQCQDKASPDCPVLPAWAENTTMGNGKPQWDGWVVEIIEHLSKAAGFSYSLQLPSGNRTGGKRNYGAADRDLKWGNPEDGTTPTVMFAGAYITVPRLADSYMSSAYATQPLALLTKTPETTLSNVMWTWTTPYTGRMWYTVLIVCVMASFTFHSYIEEDCAALVSWIKHLWGIEDGAGDGGVRPTWMERVGEFGGIMTASIKCAVWKPKTPEGRVFTITWSFCGLILVALYTANLASCLVNFEIEISPASFEQVIQSNGNIRACVLEGSAYAGFLNQTEPYNKIVQVPIPDLSGMAEALQDAQCECVIERQMHMEFMAGE
jgi:hypothetical protein